MEGNCQRDMLHAVLKTKHALGPRINLTWRWIRTRNGRILSLDILKCFFFLVITISQRATECDHLVLVLLRQLQNALPRDYEGFFVAELDGKHVLLSFFFRCVGGINSETSF